MGVTDRELLQGGPNDFFDFFGFQGKASVSFFSWLPFIIGTRAQKKNQQGEDQIQTTYISENPKKKPNEKTKPGSGNPKKKKPTILNGSPAWTETPPGPN